MRNEDGMAKKVIVFIIIMILAVISYEENSIQMEQNESEFDTLKTVMTADSNDNSYNYPAVDTIDIFEVDSILAAKLIEDVTNHKPKKGITGALIANGLAFQAGSSVTLAVFILQAMGELGKAIMIGGEVELLAPIKNWMLISAGIGLVCMGIVDLIMYFSGGK